MHWASPDSNKKARRTKALRRVLCRLFASAKLCGIGSTSRLDAFLTQPMGNKNILIFVGLFELGEFLIESIKKLFVFGAEAKSPKAANRLTVHNGILERMSLFKFWRVFYQFHHGEFRCSIGVRSSGLDG